MIVLGFLHHNCVINCAIHDEDHNVDDEESLEEDYVNKLNYLCAL